MSEIYIQIIALMFSIFFACMLYYFVFIRYKKDLMDFSWENYFKTCGIYQGTSHWTIVKKYFLKFRN